ncbi:MAG: RNA-guided endonuclease TnpB family protein [Candidatus Anstonellales archaeon]
MRKVLVLNPMCFTSKKSTLLTLLFLEYLRVSNLILERLSSARSSTELHHLTYKNIRETSFLPSDIVQEARKDVWAKRKKIKGPIKNCSIRFNNRWFRFGKTKRGNPIFRITYSPGKSVVIPIRKDRQWQRFQNFTNNNWSFSNISLLKSGRVAVVLEKEFPKPKYEQRHILGIDIGSSTLAAVSIFDRYKKKVVKQLYFGRDVAVRQRRYTERRAVLQSLADKGSERAKRALRKLKNKQRNFVKTRSGQIAKQIVSIAMRYKSSVAVERLKNIRAKRGMFNRKVNQKINLIPYGKFREFLRSNAEMFSIPIKEVDAYHTSKWCPMCGALNKGHKEGNYALYKCGCGFTCNSDRKASLAIAVKSLLERTEYQYLNVVQISNRRAPVNGLLRPDAAGRSSAVQYIPQPMEKPTYL